MKIYKITEASEYLEAFRGRIDRGELSSYYDIDEG